MLSLREFVDASSSLLPNSSAAVAPPPSDRTIEKREQRTRWKRSRKGLSSPLQVLMCVTDCKYDVVREAALARGWRLVEEDTGASAPGNGVGASARRCHVYWVDVPAIVERMQQLQPWQRINHFPGMSNVARKSRMAQNLDRMRRSFPQEYSFYPRTWVLPAEWGGFKAEFDSSGKSSRTFIIKPDSGCQGKGIFLTQDLDRVASTESQVAQLYVRNPLLVEGFKFDLRIYVLVTSVIPLRMYVFNDGLARFCTEEYLRPSSDNLGERCMHLTNYAVNKRSENFVANDDADRDDRGSKRSLSWLLSWVAAKHGQEKADLLWRRMCSACVKTLVSILPTLHREYLHTFGRDKTDAVRSKDNDAAARPTDEVAKPKETTGKHEDHSMTEAVDASKTAAAESRPSSERGRDLEKESGRLQGGPDSTGETSPSLRCMGYRSDLTRHREQDSEDAQEERWASPSTMQCSPIPPLFDEKRPDADEGAARASGAGATRSMEDRTKERIVEGSRCVEILGFDFMIDSALKSWLIEVNHLPSFATDSPLDQRIKAQVVSTSLSVLRAKADDRKSYEETNKRDAQNRLYNADGPAGSVGPSLKEQEREEAEALVAKIRRKVEAIYMRFAPQKVGKVGGLLLRYAGNEDKLLRLVRRKYVDAAGAAIVPREKSTTASIVDETKDNETKDNGSAGPAAPSHGSDDPNAFVGPQHRLSAASSDPETTHAFTNRPGVEIAEEDLTEVQCCRDRSIERARGLASTGNKSNDEEEVSMPSQAERLPEAERGGGEFTEDVRKRTNSSSMTNNRKIFKSETSTTTPASPPSPPHPPPLWAIEDDPETLASEADLLQGWERLHPPVLEQALLHQHEPPSSDRDSESRKRPPVRDEPGKSMPQDAGVSPLPRGDRSGDEDSNAGGDEGANRWTADAKEEIGRASSSSRGRVGSGKGKSVKKRRRSRVTVDSMIRRAFEDDLKMTLRLKCPLQQIRGGAMDPQPTTKLPLVAQHAAVPQNRSAPTILAPEQREKAQRLMEGYSSGRRRSSSAPLVGGNAAERKSQLPVSLRIAVVRAKEWRRRRDEGNVRRTSRPIAVKVHTFDFDGFPSDGQS